MHHARELITSGRIGRVLSTRQYSGTIAFGRKIEAASLYQEEATNGTTLVTIHGGHALDVAIAILGEIAEIATLATTQYPEIETGEHGERRSRSISDHLLVQWRLRSGSALSVEVAGGRPPDDVAFRLEVVGENGTLTLDGDVPRGFQSGRIRLSLNGEPQSLDEGEGASLPDVAVNVAGVYAALRDDIASGTFSVPDFDHAVHLTQLISDVTTASETGARFIGKNSPNVY